MFVSQLLEQRCKCLHVVLGMVGDKDYAAAARRFVSLAVQREVLGLDTRFYLTQPSCQRALSVDVFASAFRDAASAQKESSSKPLDESTFPSVSEAVHAALAAARPEDMIFVGGSCYVIADLLAEFDEGGSKKAPIQSLIH